MYKVVIGNTTVFVEDLVYSASWQNGKFQYPGICQHCGKTNIRYLAHVQQNLADTMARATGEATQHGEAFSLRDEVFCKDSAALFDGKTDKEVAVGCVCVAKYLTDCGVDAGLAKRLQTEVTKVMHILQRIAQLESAKCLSSVEKSLASHLTVMTLRERASALRMVKYWEEPALKETEARNEYHSIRNVAYKDYEEAATRWKRENFGFYTHFTGQVTAEQLDRHFDKCIAQEKMKLSYYQKGAQYVG